MELSGNTERGLGGFVTRQGYRSSCASKVVSQAYCPNSLHAGSAEPITLHRRGSDVDTRLLMLDTGIPALLGGRTYVVSCALPETVAYKEPPSIEPELSG